MPSCLPELPLAALASASAAASDEQFLLRAFRSFAETAGSLEHAYAELRAEVARLRQELEQSTAGLARSLEENRRMRQYLDHILEGLPCGVLVVADRGEVSRVNPEGRRLLGLAAGAGPLTPSELPSLLSSELRRILQHARAEAGEWEHQVCDPSGQTRWLAVRHAVVPDPEAGSSVGSSVFILRDVSEHRRLEEAEAKLRREQALAEMSAVLAHEVRNPLGSLELFAGLLAEANLGGECRQWVEHVQAGLRTLAATVNNVLHFHSAAENQCAPIDLGQLLGWAQDFFLPLAHRARVQLILHNRLAGFLVPADRHRLEQVLSNLVLNALHAMPGGGWIELSGRPVEQGTGAAIVVADTGPGIAPEHLQAIFEPGFSTRAGSPGLGLAVCRKIAEQHGGKIEVASRAGAGATFTLTLPRSQNPRGEVTP